MPMSGNGFDMTVCGRKTHIMESFCPICRKLAYYKAVRGVKIPEAKDEMPCQPDRGEHVVLDLTITITVRG